MVNIESKNSKRQLPTDKPSTTTNEEEQKEDVVNEPVQKKLKASLLSSMSSSSSSSLDDKEVIKKSSEESSSDMDKQNLTLEQFTDIVLASEGLSNNNNNSHKKNQEGGKEEDIKLEIENMKQVRVKPVVLAPRVHPINHNIGKYPSPVISSTSSSTSSSAVVVSVKPRVIIKNPPYSTPTANSFYDTKIMSTQNNHQNVPVKPPTLPPSQPQNIPLLVEEWFKTMKPSQPQKYNNIEDGVLNLSKKSSSVLSSLNSPSSQLRQSLSNHLIISTTPYVKPPLSPPKLEIRKIEKKKIKSSPNFHPSFNKRSDLTTTIDDSSMKQRAIRDIETAHTKDMHGNFPIHVAVLIKKDHLVRRYSSVLQLLGSTVDLINDDKYTPLHLAILDNNVEIVDLLLSFGANPGKRDHRGNSSFHQAVAIKSHQILKSLVAHVRCKDDLDTFNESGITPLHIAMKKNDPISVRILLQNGANLNIPETNKDGNVYYYPDKETVM